MLIDKLIPILPLWDLQKNVLTFLGILTTKSFIPLTKVEISGVKIEPYIVEL